MAETINIEKDVPGDNNTVPEMSPTTTTDVTSKHTTPPVPLVQLELDRVTYAPVTNQHKNGGNNRGIFQPAKQTTTTVLSQVSTSIEPFQLTAWMGPSGSGKTSLVSVAAGLVPIAQGSLKLNGEDIAHTSEGMPKNLVGVVWQDDMLLGNLTVEESITFAAKLKTPKKDWPQVANYVQEVLRDLGLTHVAQSLIGHGISGGERKRVAVASELVLKPSLLLLDEPTSSLDATTAMKLMQTLQQLAHNHGHAIAVVIHQPRTEIMRLLDHLLLLHQGRTVYNGAPTRVRHYLESIPSVTPLPPETGIADWMMDVVQADGHVLAEHWEQNNHKSIAQDHSQSAAHTQQLTNTTSTALSEESVSQTTEEHPASQTPLRPRMSSVKELHARPKFGTSFFTQVQLLTQRTTKQMRGEKLTRTALFLTLAYICFSALFWWRLPDHTNRVYERSSLLFFMLIAQSNGIVTTSIHVFQRERALLRRDRAKQLYGVLPFFLAKTISDMTNNVLLPCFYGAVTYYCANLRPQPEYWLKFILIFYLTMNTAQSMGLFLSIVIPSMELALILAPPITLFFMIMGGFYVPVNHIPAGIRWLSWTSFARYGYSAMLVNEFSGRDVPCDPDGDEVAVVCPVPGEDLLADQGIEGVAANFWFGVLIMISLQVIFRVLSYAVLRRANK